MCSKKWPCRIECTGDAACAATTIKCAGGRSCELVCDGNEACEGATMSCADGPCQVSCQPGGEAPCRELQMECGSADSQVTCEGPIDQEVSLTEHPDQPGCACATNCT